MPTITITPTEQVGQRPYQGLSILESATLLRRYLYVEQHIIPILAAWILEAPAYEDKYALGYHLWDHAEHANWLRERLHELRGGRADADVPPSLKLAVAEAQHACTTAELVAGLYLVIKTELLAAYQHHLKVADPSANAAEVRIIKRIIPTLENHLAWANEVVGRNKTGSEEDWQVYLSGLLRQARGIDGLLDTAATPEVARPHSHFLYRPTGMKFDERITASPLPSYETREEMGHEDNVKAQFAVFFNELWAVGALASVIFDAWQADCPWEFYYDMCHHCWDEVRHSEFGAIRLKELGDAPHQADMVLFDQAKEWPFLHRLFYLTLDLEAHFMQRKKPRVLRYQSQQDGRSLIFADADWSDEINHVRYGKKWTSFFLENDARTPDDIKDEIQMLLVRQAHSSTEKTPF